LNDLNHELNNYHEQLNISIRGQKLGEPLPNKKDKTQLLKELDQVSFKIKELNSILNNQKRELKNLELNYKIIQEKLNENENDFNQEKLISQNNKIISDKLIELDQISIRLQKNKSLYEDKKDEIEEDIKSIQKKTKKNVTEFELKRKETLKDLNLDKNNQMNDPFYTKQDLLRKNWKEICYIYDEYDIHDVNYELKAVGLSENSFFSSCSMGFTLDTDI